LVSATLLHPKCRSEASDGKCGEPKNDEEKDDDEVSVRCKESQTRRNNEGRRHLRS